jgi:hypothetical protein
MPEADCHGAETGTHSVWSRHGARRRIQGGQGWVVGSWGWLDFISLTGGVHGRGISNLGIGVQRVWSAGLGHWVTGFIKGFIVFIYPLLFLCFAVVTQDI